MKGWRCIALSLPWLAALACGGSSVSGTASSSDTVGTTPSCDALDAAPSCPATPPSFTNDVLPILNRDCNSTCHGPMMGLWELADYGDVSDWASLIRLDLVDCAMPPADAGVFPADDRGTVLAWIACGTPNN